jgi:hypothetical protein
MPVGSRFSALIEKTLSRGAQELTPAKPVVDESWADEHFWSESLKDSRDEFIEEQKELIVKQDEFIEEQKELIATHSRMIEERDQMIKMLQGQGQMIEMIKMIHERDESLNSVLLSLSWRMTSPFRLLRGLCSALYARIIQGR